MTLAQPMVFRAEIMLKGINPYVLVDAKRARQIKAGWKAPMPIMLQINSTPKPAAHINMMPVGNGSYYLYLDGNIRRSSGAQVGDQVEVSIIFDNEYSGGPQHDMLPEFAAGLGSRASARSRWDSLAPSRQKEVLRYLANLKSDAARQRNIERAILVLSGAKERFMARDWN